MTLVIDKNNANKLPDLLKKRIKSKSSKGKLVKHFGVLKRNIDGLEYQHKIRASVFV
jgi:hypothetical protein